MASATLPDADEALLLGRRHRITVAAYHALAEAGLLGPDSRVELIEGVIVEKPTKRPPHIVATELAGRLFHRHKPEGWFVSTGNPVQIVERDSEPEPDLQVVRGSPRDYQGRTHGPADAALVLEVSDSTYATDRRVKWRLYASAGVPVYWILDLNRRVLEVHTDPGPDGYRASQALGPGETATLILDGRVAAEVNVADLLP